MNTKGLCALVGMLVAGKSCVAAAARHVFGLMIDGHADRVISDRVRQDKLLLGKLQFLVYLHFERRGTGYLAEHKGEGLASLNSLDGGAFYVSKESGHIRRQMYHLAISGPSGADSA